MSLPVEPGSQPSGESFFQPTPEPAAPKASGKKVGLVAGASVLALGLLVGGGYALANGVNTFNDKDISQAFPIDTSVYAEVDLNPSNEQKLGLVSVLNKYNSIVDEADKINADKDPKEMVTDTFFEDLDYETEVKPWMGDKIAAGAWGELNPDTAIGEGDFNEGMTYEEYEKQMNDQAEVKEPSTIAVFEVKDEEKATEAATKALADKDEVFTVANGYLIIASDKEALAEYNQKIGDGNLSDNGLFVKDRKTLDIDSVATGWIDIEKTGIDASDAANADVLGVLSASGATGEEVESEIFKGRIISGITLDSGSVSNVTKVIALEGKNINSVSSSEAKGVADIANLPGNSIAALGFVGLDETGKALWEENSESIENSYNYVTTMEELEKYGITLPEDFTRVLGTESNIGAYSKATSSDTIEDNPGITVRLKGADTQLWKDITADDQFGGEVKVTEDNGVTVIGVDEELGEGTLVENEKFKEAVGDLDKAQFVGYANLSRIAELSDQETTDYGVVGINASHDKEENVTDVTMKWVF